MEDILTKNAASALDQLLDLREGERILITTDEATRMVADAFETAARARKALPVVYVLPEAKRPLTEVPEDLAALVPDSDVAVNLFQGIAGETPFRVELLRMLGKVVRRMGHGPGITESMLREGPMGVDYDKMAVLASELIRVFDDACAVQIKAPSGTDITMDIAGRAFSTDTQILDGQWGNLPAGEIWCAPVEDSANGVIVCDGSIGDLGAVPAPVRISVEKGRATKVECANAEFLARVEEVLAVDDEARVIGEMGIGLNAGARLTGNLLEDEKANRTAHIAFGNNEDMPGGQNRSRTHRDFLFRDPTFLITYADGRTERPIADGLIVKRRREPVRIAYKHILVAIDFSEASGRALQTADTLARSNHASLTVCHVTHRVTAVSPLFPHMASMPDTALARRQEEEDLDRMDRLVAEFTGRGADEYEGVVLNGMAAEEIVRFASQKGVDLIVIASVGLSGLERLMLGSVAESVARNASCPVLVAR